MIPSPYQKELDALRNDTSQIDAFDDLPATKTWLDAMGAALGKRFGVTVVAHPKKEWAFNFPTRTVYTGKYEEIFTRKGVLGLLLNAIGRIAFSSPTPVTANEARKFAATHSVDKKVAKHFGAITKTIDEIRTDQRIANEYAGGSKIVDTMHAQAYSAAEEALKAMAVVIAMKRKMAVEALAYMDWVTHILQELDQKSTNQIPASSPKLLSDIQKTFDNNLVISRMSRLYVLSGHPEYGHIRNDSGIEEHTEVPATGLARLLIAIDPGNTAVYIKTLRRMYPRNGIIAQYMHFEGPSSTQSEAQLVKEAADMHEDIEEVKKLAAHHGGHAQYVIAKAEQYYYALALGLEFISPYLGYDMVAQKLDLQAANDAARRIATAIKDHGMVPDFDGSIEFAKELLPILEPFPFLDLNDSSGSAEGDQSMQQRQKGAGKSGPKKKRDKKQPNTSKDDRQKDKRKLDNIDKKKNQEDMEQSRSGHSVLDPKVDKDPLNKYAYIIGPYISQIATLAARMRRVLKVNDPTGMRGAYNRGPKPNSKILYRHKLDDFKLFARREQEKKQSYGFAVTGDLSSSTETRYRGGTMRTIQDEILASAFLIFEVVERIGDKVACSIDFFSNEAENIKRPSQFVSRSKLVETITEFGNGTNIESAGQELELDLQDMEGYQNKTIIFITDGQFPSDDFLETAKAAKKHNASIAYFQICDNVSLGVHMCKEIENFVKNNAKGVKVRTRNVTSKGIDTLPLAMADLIRETITGT